MAPTWSGDLSRSSHARKCWSSAGRAASRGLSRRSRRARSYFLEKPIDADGVLALLEPAIERIDVEAENVALKRQLRDRYQFDNIIGRSRKMRELFDLVAAVADSEANVLIQGENGTGKELIANALHYNSRRTKGPFIKINCAAIPKDLIESELFGYRRGSFTGALTDKDGLLEQAQGGSLLLDEIGEMPPYLQTKLLRVLQEREYRPVGSDRVVRVDFRLICATNVDVEAALQRRPAPRRSVLPHQHHHAARAGAARAHGRHSAPVRSFPGPVPSAVPADDPHDRPGGIPPADSQSVAGQRA